ncbi:SDR family NAD(P)-dependent oxidoreductase [Colwelliaceae bacterium 6441]
MTKANFDLDGRVAIVTGASSGIGVVIAQQLAAAGASVALVGRNEKRLKEVAESITSVGGKAEPVIAELTAADAMQSIVQSTIDAFGQIDILVNSAGIYLESAFIDCPIEHLTEQFDVNVRVPFELCQAVVPHMKRGSSIIFISSIAAQSKFATTSAYSASKSAINALNRVLSVELAPLGISVNAVAPGWIATPMNADLREDKTVVDSAVRVTPAGRLGLPEDVAPAVVYLASQSAQFVQGTIIEVGGGYPNIA